MPDITNPNIKKIAVLKKKIIAVEKAIQKSKGLLIKEKKKGSPNSAKIDGYNQIIKKHQKIETKLKKDLEAIKKPTNNGSTIAQKLTKQKQLVDSMNPKTPVVCLPIKIETKFVGNELWIRVFPDEIFVNSLEKELTRIEKVEAVSFWNKIYEIGLAGSQKEQSTKKKKAVSDLFSLFGKERTAWVLKSSRPINLLTTDLFGAGKIFNSKPKIPNISLKEEEWTKPAFTDLLPDQFAFYLYDHSGELLKTEFGVSIHKYLQLGIDPTENNVANQLYQKGTKWLFNFDEAIKIGLGIKIKGLNSNQVNKGFSKLIVFGVKANVKPADGKKMLKGLFENHQFKAGGMEFLETGFPTKNTENSELEKSEEKELETFIKTHLSEDVIKYNKNKQRLTDGDRLINALGLDYEDFNHVKNADNKNISNSYEMSKVLWSSTMGYYIDQFTWKSNQKDLPNNLRTFFLNNVSGRGTLPTIKIDDQAYGFMPVSSFSNWEKSNESEFSEEAFNAVINPLYQNIFKGKSLKKVTNDKDTLAILNQNASSRSFSSRTMIGPMVLNNLPSLNSMKEDIIRGLLAQIGIELDDIPDVFEYAVQNEAIVLTGPIVDQGKTFSKRTLQKSDNQQKNYLSLLFNAKNFDEIIQHKFNGQKLIQQKESLLYLFVRYAYLREAVKASISYLEPAKIVNAIALIDTEFENLRDSNSLSEEMIDYLKIKEERVVLEEPRFLKFVNKAIANSTSTPTTTTVATRPTVIRRGTVSPTRIVSSSAVARRSTTPSSSTTISHASINPPVRANIVSTSSIINFDSRTFRIENANLSSSTRNRITNYVNSKVNQNVTIKKEIKVSKSKWDYLNSKYPTITGNSTMSDFLFKNMRDKKVETAQLRELKMALKHLSNLDVRELENLFTEHIDLCSHRIDAWLLGTVTDRLNKIREKPDYKNRIYFGAYGFVENIKKGKGSAGKKNGFIHAPSRAQAKTEAIARSGFEAYMNRMKKDANVKKELEALSIDINAKRTQKALSYIYGINNGQSVNSLLGFQFERALNDQKVGQFIVAYREKFGTISTQIISQDNGKAYEANNVVDGKELIEAYQNKENMFSGIKTHLNNALKSKLNSIFKDIDDSLDGLSDLLHAETLYQIVTANHSNLGAILKSLNNFTHIPKPQIVDTEIHGLKHENRIAYFFSEKGMSKAWFNRSLKSRLNPWVNEWIAQMLPNPSKIIITVTGKAHKNDKTEVKINTRLNLAQVFNKEPIDLCANFPADLQMPNNFIEKLVKVFIDKTYNSFTIDWDNIEITYSEITSLKSNQIALGDLAFIIEQINSVLKNSRMLKSSDLAANKEKNIFNDNQLSHLTKMRNSVEKNLFVLNQLTIKIQKDLNNFPAKYDDDKKHKQRFNTLYKSLIDNYLECNLSGLPQFEMNYTKETHKEILDFGNHQIIQLNKLIKNTEAIIPEKDLTVDNVKELLSRLFVQGEFVMIPFQLPSKSLLLENYSSQKFSNTQEDFNISDWMYSASKVKGNLNNLMVLNQTLEVLGLSIISGKEIKQLPYNKNIEEQWMATEFDLEKSPDNSKISFVLTSLNRTINLNASTAITGILLEEWDEIIPLREIDTGVAMHYDQPNAKSPKNILLAVPPNANGKWEWDHLINTIDETISLAKVRTVTSEDLSDTILKHFLPATIAPIHKEENQPSLDYLKNNK